MSVEASNVEFKSNRGDTAIDAAGSVFAPALDAPRRMHHGDAIRILGTIAVVINHVCDMHLDQDVLSIRWWIFNFCDAAMRWAVPAYIMLSGALLLDPARAESPTQFYKKRLGRIGIPLVFWTAFFIWFSWKFLVPRNWIKHQEIWLNLLEGKPYAHLHFIFRIAGLYAFTPMIRVFLRHAERPMQVGTVILLFAVSSADSIANAFTHNEASMFLRFTPFLGYYLTGYLLRDADVSGRQLKRCWIGFWAGVVILAVGTGLLIRSTGGHIQWYPTGINMMLYDFLSPVRIAMAICAWLILVSYFREPWPASPQKQKLIHVWAAATLGLYLVHPAFREALIFSGFSARTPLGPLHVPYILQGVPMILIGIPIMSLMVYIPSLIVTLILMRIPYVRRVTG